MDIKKRLIISNTLIVIVPFIVTVAAAAAFLFVSSRLLDNGFGYKDMKRLASVRAELFSLKGSLSKQGSELTEDNLNEYLRQSLQSLQGEYILTKGSSIVEYPKDMSKIDVQKAIDAASGSYLNNTIKINNTLYMLDTAEASLKDKTYESIVIMIPAGGDAHYLNVFIIFVAVVFVLSLIAANAYMSYELSKRILSPVKSLKNAASEISRGNLNCEIIEEGDKEIRELCYDFELMRIQLKDSINMKMKYDDNRKMLVSSISHDLKTPITSIKGYVEGILDGVANSPEKLEKYLKTIYSKAEQVDIMIDDLLLYSKLDLNQLPFNFEKTDIVQYLKDCLEEAEPELEKSNIRLSFTSDLLTSKAVMLDRERMRRVIMNIIDNSRKYMDKEYGQVAVSLRETASSIIIEFRDNGRGIEGEAVNKIFDRFYREDSARSGAKGSGLGLAIAKQIVEGHKGRIWAVSHGDEGLSIIMSLMK